MRLLHNNSYTTLVKSLSFSVLQGREVAILHRPCASVTLHNIGISCQKNFAPKPLGGLSTHRGRHSTPTAPAQEGM